MDSRTLQQLADQAQHEVDMASRMVREAELQARLARAEPVSYTHLTLPTNREV